MASSVNGFMPHRHVTSITTSTLTSTITSNLLMAKSSSSSSSAPSSSSNKPARTTNKKGNPLKPKKTRNKNDKRNENYNPNQKKSSKASTTTSTQQQLPSTSSRAPPWQVLSPKDAQKNVETEQRRRAGILMDDIETKSEPKVVKTLSKNMLSTADQTVLKWRRFNPSTAISGISFVGSYLDHRLPPRLGVPEVAFLGRSNVGKSSLLNRLVGTDGARVGKTPGATASVNLYTLKETMPNKKEKVILGLADLPGFGYAKLSKQVQQSVQEAAERYLSRREELALGILLVDSRRVPSESDRAILAALYDIGVPIVVVATKIDKLTKNEVEQSMETIREELGLPNGQPLQISSVTGEGTKALWTIILEACETRVDELKLKLERSNEEVEEEVGGLEMDEDGNYMPFDDGEELAYDQGYDWIHGTNNIYFGQEENNRNVDPNVEVYDNSVQDDVQESFAQSADLSMKDLRRKAKRMERDGDV
jgi:GTP-binding protein